MCFERELVTDEKQLRRFSCARMALPVKEL